MAATDEAEPGQHQRHALTDQHHDQHGTQQQRVAAEGGEKPAAFEQAGGDRKDRREQDARQRRTGAGFAERAGQLAIAAARVAEQIASGQQLLERFQGDPCRGGGNDPEQPATRAGGAEDPVLQRGGEQQEPDDGDGFDKRMSASWAEDRAPGRAVSRR